MLEEVDHSEDHLLIDDAVLDLREFENDAYQSRQVAFGLNRDLRAEFETVEGNVDDVLVEEKMLGLLIGEDDHE